MSTMYGRGQCQNIKLFYCVFAELSVAIHKAEKQIRTTFYAKTSYATGKLKKYLNVRDESCKGKNRK